MWREIISNNKEEQTVVRLAEAFAREYGLHEDIASCISTAAALHDVGKIALPTNLLNKPGKLTPKEFDIVKTHTTAGAEILSSMTGTRGKMAQICALYHHEKYDGTGYWGVYLDELPAYVSIVAIADVYAALTHSRPYKRAWNIYEALGYIKAQSGKHFSPLLVKKFLMFMRIGGIVSESVQ